MFPQIPYNEYPGQVLAIELYIEAGIRTCDIGSYMLGNDPDTGEQLKACLLYTSTVYISKNHTNFSKSFFVLFQNF